MNRPPAQSDRVTSILQSLGEAYLARGQYAEAAEKFAQLLQAGPPAPATYRSFALALLGLNQLHEQAQQTYRHVLQLFPNDRELPLKICRVLLLHNARDPFALQLYKQVLTLNPPAPREILHALARHFLHNEQPEPAFETLKRVALLENGEAAQTVKQLAYLGWRLEKYAECRSVLEYLAGRNEKVASLRRMLALDSAYAIHRAVQGEDQTAAPRHWQSIVQALAGYDRVEHLGALREFSALRLALGLIQQARQPSEAKTENTGADSLFARELAQRLHPSHANIPAAAAQRQILALKILNLERLTAETSAAVAQALAEKFLDFSAKYLAKAATATCYRLRDGLLAFGDSIKLLAIAAVDLLHKIERYNVTAKPAAQIWVQIAVHASGGDTSKPELSGWRMLYEVSHMLEVKIAPAVQKKHPSGLIFARALYENRLGYEVMPARYAGSQRGEVPFFRVDICEAIWRNPLEYVHEKAPQLFGKFWVSEKLRGSREAGTYRARDRALERAVILKALSPHNSYRLMQEPALREKVAAALRQTGRLALPGVAMIYDMGWQEEIFFFVREFLEGKTLEHLIQNGRRLSLPEGLALGMRVFRILQATHREGVCHGNLKPGNVWLSPSGEVKIADFYAPLFVENPDPDNLVNPASWQYSAPERRNGETVHPSGDIFSLGAILCELISGEIAGIAEENPLATPRGHQNSSLPPVLAQIVARACHPRAQERFQNFLEFEQTLRQALELLQRNHEISLDEISRLARSRPLLEKGE